MCSRRWISYNFHVSASWFYQQWNGLQSQVTRKEEHKGVGAEPSSSLCRAGCKQHRKTLTLWLKKLQWQSVWIFWRHGNCSGGSLEHCSVCNENHTNNQDLKEVLTHKTKPYHWIWHEHTCSYRWPPGGIPSSLQSSLRSSLVCRNCRQLIFNLRSFLLLSEPDTALFGLLQHSSSEEQPNMELIPHNSVYPADCCTKYPQRSRFNSPSTSPVADFCHCQMTRDRKRRHRIYFWVFCWFFFHEYLQVFSTSELLIENISTGCV